MRTAPGQYHKSARPTLFTILTAMPRLLNQQALVANPRFSGLVRRGHSSVRVIPDGNNRVNAVYAETVPSMEWKANTDFPVAQVHLVVLAYISVKGFIIWMMGNMTYSITAKRVVFSHSPDTLNKEVWVCACKCGFFWIFFHISMKRDTSMCIRHSTGLCVKD